MLAPVRSARLVEPTARLLHHASPEVRRRALQVLQNQTDVDLPQETCQDLLTDSDLEVRIEALHCLCLHGPGDRRERLTQALQSPDRRLRGAAVGCIAEYGTPEEDDLVGEDVVRGLFSHSEDLTDRVQAAHFIGTLYQPGNRPYLRESMRQLMASEEPEAIRAIIASLGQLADPEYAPWLLDKLDDWRYRTAARAALAAYGPPMVATLCGRAMDPDLDLFTRGRAIRALADIPCQEAVDSLFECLSLAEATLQYGLIKSLSKLRASHPDLEFHRARVVELLRVTAAHHYQLLQASALLARPDGSEPAKLLCRSLSETCVQNCKRIFRLLGLLYSPRDMYNAYTGYVSTRRATRGSSLEFLDNVLDRELAELLMPILDEPEQAAAVPPQGRGAVSSLETVDQAHSFLLTHPDPWLRACAAYSVPRGPALEPALRELAGDPDPVVRETAQLMAGRDQRGPEAEEELR